jgi:hypothetical protein
VAGNRPKLFSDKHDNAYLIFATRGESSEVGDDIFFLEGDLVIAAATARSQWTDWKIVHVEHGPFLNEMLGDPCRWQQEGVLSVLVQETPQRPHEATPLRLLDFSVRTSSGD